MVARATSSQLHTHSVMVQAMVIFAAPFLKAAGVGAGLVTLGVDRYRERKAKEAEVRENDQE